MGRRHYNLLFSDIFCCIKLRCPLKKKMISVRNHLHSLHTRRWAPWAWFWKKLKSLADTFPYPLWIRKVGEDTAYLCQQTIFCSFMKPACGKNAFIHWMSSDGFFWANFGFSSAHKLIASPCVGLCYCFWCSLTDLPHHCALLIFVLKTFLSISLNPWTPQSIQPVCYNFVKFQYRAMPLQFTCQEAAKQFCWKTTGRCQQGEATSLFLSHHTASSTP